MERIEKIGKINRASLSERHYFSSLLEAAYRSALLNDDELENIQLSCLALLAHKTERYTNGESSSVRIEIAEGLMQSILFTVGLSLKAFPCPDDAVMQLKMQSLETLYNAGRKVIDQKIKSAKRLHHLVSGNLMHVKNRTYHETLVDGIAGFFKIYNADFFADDIPITCDYPLCTPLPDYAGIEFIDHYLRAIYYENRFCNLFPDDAITDLLYGFDKNYNALIFNIFQQILTSATGCILAKTDLRTLSVSAVQVEEIYNMLHGKSQKESVSILFEACDCLIKTLCLSEGMQNIVKNAQPALCAAIFDAAQHDALNQLFIQAHSPAQNPQINFSFGEKMPNEKYRALICELEQCGYTADKVALIRGSVHSLADLVDLIFDAELDETEICGVLNTLEAIEIAALAKRYASAAEEFEYSEKELRLRAVINGYINGLQREKQALIEKYKFLINPEYDA